MKLKLSSFSEEKQIVKADLTCKQIGLKEVGLIDPVKVEVKLAKNRSCLTVECDIAVATVFNCDRCLNDYKSIMETQTAFAIASDYRMKSDSDDMIFVSKVEDQVDISKNIRDAILLDYPMKKLCSQTCKGLCPGCGSNLNIDKCNCENEMIDPRWEKLKQIK